MTASLVLGLDAGTSSCRALLVDARGRIVAGAAHPVRPTHHPNGWIDQDAAQCFSALRRAVRELFRSTSRSAREVDAVGLACQRSTSVVWHRDTLHPLRPAISWQCQRTRPAIETLSPATRRASTRRTGLPMVPFYAASKLQWLLRSLDPSERRRARLGTLDSFLVANLTEAREPLTDLTQASRTLLVDLGSTSWSQRALHAFDLEAEALPRIVPTVAEHGRIARGALAPLLPGTPLLAIAGDQQSALFGLGLRKRGEAKITYGSGAFLLCNAGLERPDPSAQGLIRSVAWSDAHAIHYLLESNLPSSGTVIDWLSKVTGVAYTELLRRGFARAGKLRADAYRRPLFVPTFAGMGPPHSQLPPGGALYGLTHDTDTGQIAVALAVGIACALQTGLEVCESVLGHRLAALVVDGGGSKDPRFLAIQADLLQHPLHVATHSDATAFGAAALALHALGIRVQLPVRKTPVAPLLTRRTAEEIHSCFRARLEDLFHSAALPQK